MNNQQIENIDDEISILEIIDFFRESWRQILFGGVIGGALGVGFVSLSPSIYQATANIQIAKAAGVDVESPNVLLEKLKSPTYYSPQTFVACGFAESGNAIIKELNPTLLKSTPIIRVSHKGKSIDQAKKCLDSSLNDIRINQNVIAEPIIREKKNQLSKLKQELESAKQISNVLSQKNKAFDFSDAKVAAPFFLLANALDKKNEFMNLIIKINDLELELVEPHTKEAHLITPIYAENINGEPRRSLITLGSVIGGVILMLGFLIVRRWWAKINAPIIPPQVGGDLK